MILKYFINPKPSIIFFFILFCVLFQTTPLIKNTALVLFPNGKISTYLLLGIYSLIISFHALGINNLVYEKNIIKKDNIVLAFIYLLLSTPFYDSLIAFFVSFILLFFISFLFESYKKPNPLNLFFNATIIISTISLFYPHIIFLLILILINGINFENLNWRGVIVILIGVLLPYIFYFVFCVLAERIFTFPNFETLYFKPIVWQKWSIVKYLWVGIVILISLFSFFELLKWLYKKSIRSRKSFVFILLYFMLCLILAIYSYSDFWYYLISPLSIVIANYFVYTKNQKMANFLFLILIISSFTYKYMIAINL